MLNLPDDPAQLLALARELEPGLQLDERTAALDRAIEVLSQGERGEIVERLLLECDAERAIDLARVEQLAEAKQLAQSVFERAGARDDLAVARATEALGRAFAWDGTESAARTGAMYLREAAERYAALDEPEWQGYVTFWIGNAVHFENGELAAAEADMRDALRLIAPDSARRAPILSFLADVLVTRGDWTGARAVLDEASLLAVGEDDVMARAYVAWTRARIASAQGDSRLTERYIHETERNSGAWFEIHTGAVFLADAAEMLDRVGQVDASRRYLERALDRAPTDEFVLHARAALLARRGDADEGLQALQQLSRGDWLEKRMVWRHTLLAAYATLRAGRSGAGQLAALALEQAAEVGGVVVATSAEPAMVEVLLPLAERAGSLAARDILAPQNGVIVRILGATSFARGGTELTLPPGQAAELARMLAVQSNGLTVDEVLERLFGEVDPDVGRHRLRQLLTRLRGSAGNLVVRDGELLRLNAGWVDAVAFRRASDVALAATGPTASELAYAALALWAGPPLGADAYAGWAHAPREQLRHRYLALLDVVADAAVVRGSSAEALRMLGEAREEDPYDESRYVRAADILVSLGRRGAAVQLAREAETALRQIAVPLPAVLRELLHPRAEGSD